MRADIGSIVGLLCVGTAALVYAGVVDVKGPPRPIVPDPTLTPGAVETSDPDVICAPGYLASRPRKYGTAEERAQWKRVFASYHVPLSASREYELDHLVPRCLGGADTDANLWPQTREGYWNAAKKDEIERETCKAACSEVPLSTINLQRSFARNWVRLYQFFIQEKRRSKTGAGSSETSKPPSP